MDVPTSPARPVRPAQLETPATRTVRGRSRRVTSERIVQAAIEVFSQDAPGPDSLSRIAAQVGTSKANLYNYFRGRDQIYLAAHQVFVMDTIRRAAGLAPSATSPRDWLELVAGHVMAASGHPLLRLSLDLCERATRDPELREDLVEAYAVIHAELLLVLERHWPVAQAKVDRQVSVVLLTSLVLIHPVACALEPSFGSVDGLSSILSGLLGLDATA